MLSIVGPFQSHHIFLCIPNLSFSIFTKTQHVIDQNLPKALHLLDDSEIEESHQTQSQLTSTDASSPCSDISLQASTNTADNSTLLTR